MGAKKRIHGVSESCKREWASGSTSGVVGIEEGHMDGFLVQRDKGLASDLPPLERMAWDIWWRSSIGDGNILKSRRYFKLRSWKKPLRLPG